MNFLYRLVLQKSQKSNIKLRKLDIFSALDRNIGRHLIHSETLGMTVRSAIQKSCLTVSNEYVSLKTFRGRQEIQFKRFK